MTDPIEDPRAAAWHELEKSAMTGNRSAVLAVVSALRGYRRIIAAALSTRYGDGAIDGYHATVLADDADEIAAAHLEEE